MGNTKHIAFIGGGSVGPVLMIYLAKLVAEKNIQLSEYTFHLIDPHGFCNGGIAYGKCAPNHILNTLPNEMSPWDKVAFYKFVCSKGRDKNTLKFHLRADYKQFLRQEFNKAKAILSSHGVQFMEHHTNAFVKSTGNNQFQIVDSKGNLVNEALNHLSYEQINLTVGYGPNMNFQKLLGEKNYIHCIYPIDQLDSKLMQKTKPVRIAVFGSAAGLYDFVISLPLKPEHVQLYVFSSANKGMEVRQVETEHTLKDLPLEKLKALDKHATSTDIANAIKYEQAFAEKIQAGPPTWTAFRIMGIIGEVLSKVDKTVAKDFRKSHLFKTIKRLGNPTTKYSSNVLKSFHPEFISSDVRTANIKTLPNETFQITTEKKSIVVDYIVNLSGHGRHNSAILEDMKQQGLAVIDEKLDILATNQTKYRLLGSYIACVGPATHFGTDGIESFAKYAKNLAYEIISSLEAEKYTPMYS